LETCTLPTRKLLHGDGVCLGAIVPISYPLIVFSQKMLFVGCISIPDYRLGKLCLWLALRAIEILAQLKDQRSILIIATDTNFGMCTCIINNIVHFDLKSESLLVNLRYRQPPICKVRSTILIILSYCLFCTVLLDYCFFSYVCYFYVWESILYNIDLTYQIGHQIVIFFLASYPPYLQSAPCYT
jgi:hypothetical protein